MSNIDAARKTAEQWATQGKQFDPKKFDDYAARQAAEAAYNAAKKK